MDERSGVEGLCISGMLITEGGNGWYLVMKGSRGVVGGDVMSRNCPIYAATTLKSCHCHRNEEIDPKKSNLKKSHVPYPTISDYNTLSATKTLKHSYYRLIWC